MRKTRWRTVLTHAQAFPKGAPSREPPTRQGSNPLTCMSGRAPERARVIALSSLVIRLRIAHPHKPPLLAGRRPRAAPASQAGIAAGPPR